MSARLRAPWALALAVAAPLAAAYLIAAPPSGDLAAATHRANLFAHAGFTLWDDGWYGGHYLPGYSLLSPALGVLLGERLLLALSVVAAAGLFGALVARAFDPAAARIAAALFALGIAVELLSGRVAYDLGLAIGLLALLELQRGRFAAALALAVLTSATSPVAGAFLALAGLALALAQRRRSPWRGAALALAALAPIVVLAALFPEGGWEPFAPSVFWPGLAGVLAIALALALPWLAEDLPAGTARAIAWGAWLYAAALVGAYALHTPVGSNAARLGALLAAPLVAGALWTHRRPALALLAPVLLYWQLETPLNDYAALAGDPSVHASYYAPLTAELERRAQGRPLRVEIPQTGAHWEAVYVPEHAQIALARGWERQLDTRYAGLFYGPRLTPAAYRAWLAANAVAYVALPDVRLDFSAQAEGRLIRAGLPYLQEVWRSAHWRLFAVRAATPLAQPPARLSGLGTDSFALRAPRAGRYLVRVRFTPYWAPRASAACVSEAPGGWTYVRTRAPGAVRVGIDFALGRSFARSPRCS